MLILRISLSSVLLLLLGSGCERPAPTLFAPTGGIDFVNALPENDSVNIVTFQYLYNGGGVGVGDFDRDGRPDLVFSGNFVSSALYLQKKAWTFQDATAAAGLTTNVWCSGVNISDVDGNGWEDIYFATLNPDGSNDTPNLLYLNQGTGPDGIPRFTEAAAEYGLDDTAYGTHSAWFDYENDGDLDLYVLNNAIEDFNRNVAKGTDTSGRGRSTDRLYLLNPDAEKTPTVTENSRDENNKRFYPTEIKTEGWGLGIAVQDFNQDGFADLYVANDFLSDDFLLINQRGRGLKDELRARLPHQSRNAMGVDVADLTGDGQPEIMVVDMLPDDNLRRKTMFGDIPHQGKRVEEDRGYANQYVRNTLQLNHGNGYFSDVAFQAGVAATDWSWTPLLADFDNDGRRDIFVSNGYPKDITNRDFSDFGENSDQFGTRTAQQNRVIESLAKLGGVHQPNFFFRNEGDLSFARREWLPDEPTYSNGAVFVDLDGDGDLDLVTNNINETAGVFRNHSRERQPSTTNYLQISLTGPAGNPHALGTKIWVEHGETKAYHEHYRQRGYLSSVGQTVHFGLGKDTLVERLTVRFPDGTGRVLTDLGANRVLELAWEPGLPEISLPTAQKSSKRVLPPARIPADGPVHREALYADFDHHHLAVRDHSRNGPAMAAMDLNGDGNDELIFGGGAGQAVSVWRMTDEGALTQVQSLDETAPGETTALLTWSENGKTYLYVGQGSSEFARKEAALTDLIYTVTDGKLTLASGNETLPRRVTAAVVRLAGPKDAAAALFVGSRMRNGDYPYAAPSAILTKDGGTYAVEREIEAGMVTAAAGADLNNDGYADLVTAGDYEPIRIFFGGADGLGEPIALPNTSGWYYSLTATDLDGDGDTDLLAGNLGPNSPYAAGPQQPVRLLADDFDGNGTTDPILTAFNGGTPYPVVPRNTLTRQLPGLKRRIPNFTAYGNWTAADLPQVKDGLTLSAVEFRSLYLKNDGAGNFTVHPLPARAQLAPIQDALPFTLPDGRPALLAVMNDYGFEPLGGRLDAGRGVVITTGDEGLPQVLDFDAGLNADARSVVRLRRKDGGFAAVVGVNRGPARVMR